MALEIGLCFLQVPASSAHRFKSFVNVRMRWRRSRGDRGRRNRYYGGSCRHRSFRPGCRCRESQRKEKCCHDEQSQKPNLFHVFLLVRIPVRTQPVCEAILPMVFAPVEQAIPSQSQYSRGISEWSRGDRYLPDAALRRFRHQSQITASASRTTTARSSRLMSPSSRPQCCPKK